MPDWMTLGSRWSPRLLSLLRFFAGFMFLQHGTQKILGFPGQPSFAPEAFSLIWFAGVLEMLGGLLVAVGLCTRSAAFVMSGEMAVAYFKAHAPHGFWTAVNHGDLPVLYCFVFLYLAAAGGGPWSLDALIWKRRAPGSGGA